MRYLLDSNVLYWYITDRSRLTRRVEPLLDDAHNDLYVSSASLWELSIKIAKSRLAVPGNTVLSLYEQVDRLGITVLPISRAHILRTETLPHHHGDPFDRIIIAQALEEGFTILTADADIPQYAAPVIWK
ncbi:PIN domain-containing protein [Granulicella sp. 5B5]|uniref:type II toxin-antitoxin system VapC family toxin n=1 Tax=Granulicella sp. 5B5 TaxID=1617967 RepID=UPI0015F649FD|nr:type II toxin-antitoxin system VapC family toxin [Granulicella sp. 5B5]QMV18325.1 PIN domain-containing protein [Granulicella sp. 5B5]